MDFTPLVQTDGPVEVFGKFIAHVHGARQVFIRSAASLTVKRVLQLPSQVGVIRALIGCAAGKLAVLGDAICLCFDMHEEGWTKELVAEDRITRTLWLEDGSALAYQLESSLKMVLWSLLSDTTATLRGVKGIERRATESTYAVLQRDVKDAIRIIRHIASGWITALYFELDTIDAAAAHWSPDGRWLAVVESSVAYRVLFYTCDGRLMRDYKAYDSGLGVRTLVWCPSSEAVAIGSCDERIRILDTTTFAPLMDLSHPSIVKDLAPEVWREVHNRFEAVNGYVSLSIRVDVGVRPGIGTILFNGDGSLVATKNDNAPTTVWIWSMRDLSSVAVLIHQDAVRSARWLEDDTLVWTTHSHGGRSTKLYVWQQAWPVPRVVPVPADNFDARLLRSLETRTIEGRDITGVLVGSGRAFTVGYTIEQSSGESLAAGRPEGDECSTSLILV